MNFEDEPYVRIYTRDTKTWLRLGFEGQVVLALTLRKLDRSGVLDDIDDATSDVALIIGAPVEIVRVGLQRLLDLEVMILSDGRLVMPNFLEAQNCRQSDRVRKQESRAKRRSVALGTVTNRDRESQNVTECHQPSPTVTVGHSYLSIAELSIPDQGSEEGATPAADAAPSLSPSPNPGVPAKKPKTKLETDPNVLAVFKYWQAKLHPRAVLDAPRAKAVRRQLDAGRIVADLCRAVDGCSVSSWHIENGQTDLELICRDAKHVEQFLEHANRHGSGAVPRGAPTSAAHQQPPAGKSFAAAMKDFQ